MQGSAQVSDRTKVALLGVGLLAVSGLAAAPATAELDRPAQLDAASAEGLAYTRVPPPAMKRVCIVDSGVAENADTARVIARLSVDGVFGGDVDGPYRHGTSMAMQMAAERNGQGMVGVWPLAELISYRAVRTGSSVASFEDYYLALRGCTEQPGIGVISLSLAEGSELSADQRELMRDAVVLARSNGLNVVAAAGNDGGAVKAPARLEGVFAVAAGDGSGGHCGFASRGPEVDLLAPGCGLDVASPFTLLPERAEGSSHAAAMTAQVIAALRSYKPALSVSEAETAMRSRGDRLDVAGVFRSQGLGVVIDDGLAAAPMRSQADGPPGARARLPRPRLVRFVVGRRCSRRQEFVPRRCWPVRRRYRKRRQGVLLAIRNLSSGANTEVSVLVPRRDGLRVASKAVHDASPVQVRTPRGWRQLRVRLVPERGARTLPSRPVFVSRR
jgi:Subtilase family